MAEAAGPGAGGGAAGGAAGAGGAGGAGGAPAGGGAAAVGNGAAPAGGVAAPAGAAAPAGGAAAPGSGASAPAAAGGGAKGDSASAFQANRIAGVRPGSTARGGDADKIGRMLRRAARMYVQGDQVAGHKFVVRVGDDQKLPLREVDPGLTEPVRRAFVEPPDWDRTRAVVGNRPLVLLRGQSGHGRVAAAIRLLQAPSDRHIYHLDREADLHRFPHWLDADAAGEDPLPDGAGFLLCDPAGKVRLEGGVLHQITAALERHRARMIVTLNADVVVQDDDVSDFVVPLGDPPGHRDVLASHLRWRLAARFEDEATGAATATQILADADVAVVVEETLADAAPVKVAANLAMMIDQQFDGERVDVEGLRAQVGERVVEDFGIWFGALPDVPARSLAIALAVLNGTPYEDVARAAGRLRELLDGPPQVVAPGSPALQPPWRDPFALPRRGMLRMLRARMRTTTEFGTFGRTPVEVVEYIDPDRPRSVLDHVWHEFQFQRPLLDWLRGLAVDPSDNVRTFAGTALGVLATYAFDFVHAYAIQPMATEENPWAHDVVAYAMRIPARDTRLFPLVRRLANRLQGSGNPAGQATSARVRGLAMGPLDLSSALDRLDRLAMVDDWRVAWAIGDSFADLMVEDEDRYAADLLNRLADWHDDHRRTLSAQYVFHHLAMYLRTHVQLPAGESGEREWQTWPGLLLLADRRRDLRPVLIGCWARALNAGLMQDRVTDALKVWADWAESYPGVRIALARMLAAVAATSPRTRAIILRHAASWVWPDEMFPLPAAAEAVAVALKARTDAA